MVVGDTVNDARRQHACFEQWSGIHVIDDGVNARAIAPGHLARRLKPVQPREAGMLCHHALQRVVARLGGGSLPVASKPQGIGGFGVEVAGDQRVLPSRPAHH